MKRLDYLFYYILHYNKCKKKYFQDHVPDQPVLINVKEFEHSLRACLKGLP